MDLGLYLCWSDEGRELEKLTEKLRKMSFSDRLNFLEKLVQAKFKEVPEILDAYNSWLTDAHELRELRNILFHGRWGFEVREQKAVNVLGLPTSSLQTSRSFSIQELRNVQKTIKELMSRLYKLRKLHPV